MSVPPDSPTAFFVCVFGMLAKLAEADGHVSELENKTVKRYLKENLRLGFRKRRIAMKAYAEGLQSPLELRDYAVRFQEAYPDRVVLKDQIITILLELSVADGVLSPQEDKLIRSAALLLDLSEAAYERMRAKYVTAEQHVH